MNRGDQDEPNSPPSPSQGYGLDDVLYTIFRHKRIIMTWVVIGITCAVGVRMLRKPVFESHAEISVPYISESTGVRPNGTADQIKATDPTGLNVLSMEIRILSALDLAEKVAQKVGPVRILAAVGGGDDLKSAAWHINKGLTVATPTRAATLTVSFRHREEKVVQPVLEALIEAYRIKSSEIHQGLNSQVDHLLRKREESRTKLNATEEAIKQIKTQNNILFLDDTKEAYKEQIAKVQRQLFEAREELAGRQIDLNELKPMPDGKTNSVESSVEPEQADAYGEAVMRLDELKKRLRKQVGELEHTDKHPEVIRVRQQIAELTQKKTEMERQYPALARMGLTLFRSGTNAPPKDINAELEDVKRLVGRVEQLKTSLAKLQTEAVLVMELEPQIAALQRQHDDELKDYQFFSSKMEMAQEGVATGTMTDVRVIQKPTPPGLDNSKLMKMVGVAFAGCIAMGLGIAFLIDHVLDRTIKRSSDVKRLLHLPVMLTVPHTAWSSGWCPAWLSRKRNRKIQSYDARANSDVLPGETGISPWNPVHHLRTYTDGLRERLITYFEVNHLTHQPKSVAVTSCGSGVGVTTLASGLAASLSMTGNGNVLLVDMNVGEGAVHSFHKGKPGCGLTEEPQAGEDPAVTSANLYLASVPAGGNATDNLSKALPSVFNDLMPKLKVSGYDYVVFDLPPVTQTSQTPRLSGHMDMVLLVIESEKTSRQIAVQASVLMRDSRANVVTVLNKCRQHVPASLATEF